MAVPAGTEFVNKALNQIFEDFRMTTELTAKMQQDLFHQWTAFWPGISNPAGPTTGKPNNLREEWTQKITELTRMNQELWEGQYKAAVASLEGAMRAADVKECGEHRQEMMGLLQKSFDCLKELAQAQVRNFQTAVEKWIDLAKKINH